MIQIHEAFSSEFKELWEPDSQLHTTWEQIEILYNGVKAFAQLQSRLHSKFRPLEEIEGDLVNERQPMELLYLEFVRVLWTKIILRTIFKVIEAMQIVFYSANIWNAYGCAIGVRSILEHVAFLQNFANKTPWLEKKVIHLKEAIPFTKDLLNLVSGSRFDWDRLYNGQIRQIVTNGKWERPKEECIPYISKLIESLEAALYASGKVQYKNEVKFLYAMLCDVVHPSWGGDFIYGPSMYKNKKESKDITERFKLVAVTFCGSLSGLLAQLIRLCDSLKTNMPDLIIKSEK